MNAFELARSFYSALRQEEWRIEGHGRFKTIPVPEDARETAASRTAV